MVRLKTGISVRVQRLAPTISGTLLWPTFALADASTDAADVVTTPDLRHHYRYQAGADAANVPFDPSGIQVDTSHHGTPLPSVRLLFFPRPAVEPVSRADFEREIERAREREVLREARTDASGRFFARDLPYGEVWVVPEWPFQFCFPTESDNRIPAPDDQAPLADRPIRRWMTLTVEKQYELVPMDDPSVNGEAAAATTVDRGLGQGHFGRAHLGVRGKVTVDGQTWNGRMYALPMMDVDDRRERATAIDHLGAALAIEDEAFLEARIRAARMLDVWPLLWHEAFDERTIRGWLERTLFEHPGGDLGLASDQILWGFRPGAGSGEQRPMLSWIPLEDEFLQQCHAHVHQAGTERSWLWGRIPLRHGTPAMERGDVVELKVRLILWGDQANFVDVTADGFDAALRRALVRYKTVTELHFEEKTVSAVVDRATFERLDEDVPDFDLAAVDSQGDPNRAGQEVFPESGFDRLVHFAIQNGRQRLHATRNTHVTSGYRCLDHNRNVYLTMNPPRLRWRLASNAPGGIMGANGAPHAAGAVVSAQTVVWAADRGTYRGGQGDFWAPDYSRHIMGEGVDFRYAPSNAAATLNDWTAFGAMGATNAHTANHIWREPMNIGNPANRIHLDTGDIPEDNRQYVLTDEQRDGPKFLDTVVIHGTITDAGGTAVPYAIVELSGGGITGTREFAADANGDYVVYGRGTQFPGPYTLTILSNAWDEQTVNDMIPRDGDAISRVRRTNPTSTAVQVAVDRPGVAVVRDVQV